MIVDIGCAIAGAESKGWKLTRVGREKEMAGR
jgi:hypothetical protein